ncbi:MAG: phospholipase D-like domain-containing protein [Wenzhouxiangella sp.]
MTLTSPYLAGSLLAFLAAVTSIHALMYKRDPKGAFGWIAVCLLLPLGGPLLYLLFGLNRSRVRARRLGLDALAIGFERGQLIGRSNPLPEHIAPEHRGLAQIGQALSRYPLVDGNQVQCLRNGEAAFPAMLGAIEAARHEVLLSTYLFDHDAVGHQFIDALARAHQRGVDCRVLIDGVGDWYSLRRSSRELRRRGIHVCRFLPPRLLPPCLSINLRSHHKILLADQTVGFTGGMNISQRHCVDDPGRHRPTADLHFALHGPVLGQLRSAFCRSWEAASGQPPLSGDGPVDQPVRSGQSLCRTITDGPYEDLDRLNMLLCAALAEARRRVCIMTPYFLPGRDLITALQAAAIRGVQVDIVLPSENNLRFVHWATRNLLWEVLFYGVRVYYQPPPFNHGKLFTVDADYALIGSANLDPRSLRLNFELQVEIYDQQHVKLLTGEIDERIRAGRPVTLEEVDSRSLPVRFRDSLCWLFKPYL